MGRTEPIYLPDDTARHVAVNALLDFEHDGERIRESLSQRFEASKLQAGDRRLASELAYGSCRRLITLDHLIVHYARRQIRRIDTTILQILRVGIYQLLFQSASADYASVDQAVRQAKLVARGKAAPFVNAVLRSLQRDLQGAGSTDNPNGAEQQVNQDDATRSEPGIDALPARVFPDPAKQPAKALSRRHGLPLWLVERWLKHFAEDEFLQIAIACNHRPPLTLRCHIERCTVDQLQSLLEEGGYACRRQGDLLLLESSAQPTGLPGFQEGFFVAQDVTAASAVDSLPLEPGQVVLDRCAAPGGKTAQLATRVGPTGRVVACDVSPDKLAMIRQTAQRLGLNNIRTCLPEELDRMRPDGGFDAILVDAPCSNTGVLARRVEVRHRLKPNDLRKCQKIQLELLSDAASCLKSDGYLLYSTCSIDRLENESVVEAFLIRHPAFTCKDRRLTLPCYTVDGCIPRSDNVDTRWSEGGFVALLQHGNCSSDSN